MKRMDMVNFLGQMEKNLEDCGRMENKMEKEKYIIQMKKNGKKDIGMMEKEWG